MIKLPDRRLRLAFFGTPEIAKTIFARVLDTGEDEVVFAVCQPDKPKGRGKKIEAPPVKELAEARGIEVLQPLKLKDGALAERMNAARLDLAIVVAYGRILPEAVFAAPACGTWNVHASLLPRHRGASPIQHAILAGDAETGVTLMELTAGLDEGPMLLERRVAIDPEDTAGSLTEKLAVFGAEALVEGIRLAKRAGLEKVEQDGTRATYASLLEKEDGKIDFALGAEEIARRIRALSPWPGAFVPLGDGQPLKIVRARATRATDGAPGTVIEAGARLLIATGAGTLEVLELQPPGKKPMGAADWLRGSGRALKVGAAFPGEP